VGLKEEGGRAPKDIHLSSLAAHPLTIKCNHSSRLFEAPFNVVIEHMLKYLPEEGL